MSTLAVRIHRINSSSNIFISPPIIIITTTSRHLLHRIAFIIKDAILIDFRTFPMSLHRLDFFLLGPWSHRVRFKRLWENCSTEMKCWMEKLPNIKSVKSTGDKSSSVYSKNIVKK